jgi:hypothetical protein
LEVLHGGSAPGTYIVRRCGWGTSKQTADLVRELTDTQNLGIAPVNAAKAGIPAVLTQLLEFQQLSQNRLMFDQTRTPTGATA